MQDRKTYGIPVRISGVSSNLIEEKEKVALLIYQVDDLQGWYTVERLEKCGEPEGSYPNSPKHPRQKYLLTVKGLAVFNSTK